MAAPNYREDLEKKMAGLKDDPELAPILEEIEKGGPATMMKYWNDPRVLGKLGKAFGGMGGAFPGMPGGMPGAHAHERHPVVSAVLVTVRCIFSSGRCSSGGVQSPTKLHVGHIA